MAGSIATPACSADQPLPTSSAYTTRKNVTPIAAYSSTVMRFTTVNVRLRKSDGGTSGLRVWRMRCTNARKLAAATASAAITDALAQPRGPASMKAHVLAARPPAASSAPVTSRRPPWGSRDSGTATRGAAERDRRDRHVEQERPAPSGTADERAAQEGTDRAGRTAESRPRADRRGAVVGAEAGLDDREAARCEERAADTLQDACADEHLDVRRDPANQRRECEPRRADHEDLAAADAVAERAAEQDQRRECEQVAGEHPLQRAHACMEVATDVGQRDVDDRGVERRHRARRDRRDERDPSLRAAQRDQGRATE